MTKGKFIEGLTRDEGKHMELQDLRRIIIARPRIRKANARSMRATSFMLVGSGVHASLMREATLLGVNPIPE